MSRIFWDSNIWIYGLEEVGGRGAAVQAMHRTLWERGDQLFTSALAMAEILVKPMEAGDFGRCRFYEETIAAGATILGFEAGHAGLYARIRRDRSIRPADAVHLACAAAAGMDLFITHDARLQGKRIEGIQFIVPLERAPL